MRDNTKMEKRMEKESASMQIKILTKASGKMIYSKGMENIHILILLSLTKNRNNSIKENGRMDLKMEKDFMFMKMELELGESGKINKEFQLLAA